MFFYGINKSLVYMFKIKCQIKLQRFITSANERISNVTLLGPH